MKRVLSKGKEFIKNRKKLAIIAGVFIVGLVAVIVPSFAASTPIASVEIESEKLSYNDNTPGAWKITKSAKWIEKGKARITIDIDTKLKTNDSSGKREVAFPPGIASEARKRASITFQR